MKKEPNTAHQRALLERCSHIQARPHDSSTVSAARATTSLGCGIRSATATGVGARIRPNRHRRSARSRSAHAAARPGGPPHPPASGEIGARVSKDIRTLAVARVPNRGAARGAAATGLAAGLAAFHHKEILRVPGNASTRRGAVARTVPKRAVGFHRRGPHNEPHSPLTDPSPVCLCSGSRRRRSAPGKATCPQP